MKKLLKLQNRKHKKIAIERFIAVFAGEVRLIDNMDFKLISLPHANTRSKIENSQSKSHRCRP